MNRNKWENGKWRINGRIENGSRGLWGTGPTTSAGLGVGGCIVGFV